MATGEKFLLPNGAFLVDGRLEKNENTGEGEMNQVYGPMMVILPSKQYFSVLSKSILLSFTDPIFEIVEGDDDDDDYNQGMLEICINTSFIESKNAQSSYNKVND